MSVSARVKEIAQESIKVARNDLKSAISALEDGQYLSDAGYTDADQEDIEDAHSYLKEFRYFVTVDGKAGLGIVPQNACIVTDGQCMIAAPMDSWTAPAYIHAINPDARIGRSFDDCFATIKDMIDKQAKLD